MTTLTYDRIVSAYRDANLPRTAAFLRELMALPIGTKVHPINLIASVNRHGEETTITIVRANSPFRMTIEINGKKTLVRSQEYLCMVLSAITKESRMHLERAIAETHVSLFCINENGRP
jgi:hypothetical protein